MKKFINPLDSVDTNESTSSNSSHLDSKSSMMMDDASICPKCKKTMGNAIIENGESAFWCNGCRVSSPKPIKV